MDNNIPEPVLPIPDNVQESYDLLVSENLVEITQPLEWGEDERDGKGWVFKFNIKTTVPNKAEIPASVKFRALIRESFPFLPVIFYSEEETVRGFPHQDAITGKLCLAEEHEFTIGNTKLVEYVKAVQSWVKDASEENLLKGGEPYELPDFGKSIKFPPFLFDETNQSFEIWNSYIGKTGTVTAKISKHVRGIFAGEFSTEDFKKSIWKTRFKKEDLEEGSEIFGSWILIPDIRYLRHRPPQTFKEIKEICRKFNIDFDSILKTCWQEKNGNLNKGFVLIGFPISLNVGEEPCEIHWQAMFFNNARITKKEANQNPKKFKPAKVWNQILENDFERNKPLPWVASVNISKNRLLARGVNPNPVSSWDISLFGCGSLGSSVAEMLVKGGVKGLNLFDHDIVQYGNLCRHCLDGEYLNVNKALALADRLNKSSPFSLVKGFDTKVPGGIKDNATISKVIDGSNLILECTTNISAAEWLSKYAHDRGIRMATVFFGWRAEYLTVYISGETNSNSQIYKDILEVANQPDSPIPREYFYKPTKSEQIIEGAGCWHPTFPASYTHVQMLSSSAVSLLLGHLKNNTKKGFVAIIKRNTGMISESHVPLIEVVWTKIYP